MNAERHTHRVELTRSFPYSDAGAWWVKYGDTTVRYAAEWRRVDHWSPAKLERKVARAAAKAIRRHDEGSIRAGQHKAAEAAARAKAQELAGKAWPA